jgi:DNA-binding transcriptional MerR regulator
VRALRLYEEHGLIAPRRSSGGWRQYGPEDLVKLNTVSLLKTAGLTLAQIRDVTRASPHAPSLQQILEIQLGTWKARRQEADRGQGITEAALERLRTGQSLSVDDLCNLIRSFEMTQTSQPATPSDIEEVSLAPEVLDRYEGFYAAHDGEFGYHTLKRSDGALLMQIGLQQIALYAVGEAELAAKNVDFRVRIVRDADGEVRQFVLTTAGVDQTCTRIDAATAERLRGEIAARIEARAPRLGSEAALRRLLEGIRAGAPPYEEMSPEFAQIIRSRLSQVQPLAAYLGEIQSIEFQGVGSQGWDVYDVHRERGSARWRIAFSSSGKILGGLGVLTGPVGLGP